MGTIRQWIQNARPVSLAQSLLPAVLAVILAVSYPGFNLLMGVLAVVGVVFAHFAMNLADDYFDYRVDMLGARDRVIRKGFRAMTHKYPYLTDGSETPRSLMGAILCMLGLAAVLGLVIFLYRMHGNGFATPDGAWWIVVIAGVTGILGIFYSAPPLKLGYRGLGELVIGVIFGPLLMMGVFYSAAGCLSYEVIFLSIPVGLLVTNILYTHSFIDMAGDEASNKMTFARLLPGRRSRLACVWLINLLPFAIVVAGAVLGYIEPVYLAVILVIPRAIWLCRSLVDFADGKTGVPEIPPLILGNMKNWQKYRESGTDWFMMRWLAARNTLAAFCEVLVIAKICLLIYGLIF